MSRDDDDATAPIPSAMITLASGEDGEASNESLEGRRLRANVASRLFAGRAAPIKVGRFEIRELLGRGAMGVVYRAYDPQLDRDVAIKVLSSRHTDSPTRRDRMIREAQAMAKLSHPNVVTVHEVGEVDEGVFIAMELVEGATLSQWMRDQPRAWREVRDVFVAAGHGLAAAHAAGVSHRDFKPDNVMIGHDGRVRVMDFGLAHVGLSSPTSSSEAERESSAEASTSLTRSGEMLGTPAYMAPEQFRGIADPRSDQFSFCVALFEALFGVRPFAGTNVVDLMWAAASGEIRRPDPAPKLPRWLQRAVIRGLSPDPADRYATMDALLDALTGDRLGGHRRTLLAIGGLTAVAAAVALALQPSSRACEGAPTLIAPTWSAARADALTEAFASTGLPFAAGSAALATGELDELAARWVEVHTAVCQRGLRREMSDELLDRRMSCLDEQLRALEGSVKVLERAEPEIIERSMDVVMELPRADACMRSSDAIPLLPPAAVASEIHATRALLAEADALERAGQWTQAERLAKDAVERARRTGWTPLEAEALRSLGMALVRGEHHADALDILMDGFFVALRAERHEIAAVIAEYLVRALGHVGRGDEAMTWGRHADVVIERSAAGDPQRARLEDALAGALTRAGRFAEAVERYGEAIALAERVLPEDDLRLAVILSNSAQPLSRSGDHDEAARRLERAAAIFEARLGPDHPKIAITLNNLGIVLKQSRRLDESLAVHERALVIRERALGPNSPHTLSSLTNISLTLAELGRNDEALEMARDVVERTRQQKDDPLLKARIMNLGWMLDRRGQLDDALALFEEALSLSIDTFGPEHAETATAHHNVGAALADLGRGREAIEHLERAIELRRRHHGAEHDLVAHSLLVLGTTQTALGLHDEAIRLIGEALSIRQRNPQLPPAALTHTMTSLGEALDAAGDRKAALQSFERAVSVAEASSLEDRAAGRARLRLAMALPADPPSRARAIAQARQAVALLRTASDPLAPTAIEWLQRHGG